MLIKKYPNIAISIIEIDCSNAMELVSNCSNTGDVKECNFCLWGKKCQKNYARYPFRPDYDKLLNDPKYQAFVQRCRESFQGSDQGNKENSKFNLIQP